MPCWQFACGVLVTIVGIGAITLMIYLGCMAVIHDIREEAMREARHQARILAERMYQEMLATTQFRVRVGLRIVDEMHRKG